MKSLVLAVVVLVIVPLATGCQRESDKAAPVASVVAAPPGSAYAKDIEALCDCVSRSGADKIDPDAKMLTVATWLAQNMTTPESKSFLVRIQPLGGTAKADALEGEAKRVGLSGCALAAEWRGTP
jgi:hypothetical protein